MKNDANNGGEVVDDDKSESEEDEEDEIVASRETPRIYRDRLGVAPPELLGPFWEDYDPVNQLYLEVGK